jgi:hypothetical protein
MLTYIPTCEKEALETELPHIRRCSQNSKTMSLISVPSITILSASPKCGKSHLIKYLIKDLCIRGAFDYGVVICPTALNNNEYDFIPRGYLHTQYSEEIITALMDYQSRAIAQGTPKRAFLILDDCLGSVNFRKTVITKLVTTYRHHNITILMSTQYINKIPPEIRECATYAIVFRQFSAKSYSALYDAFFQSFEDRNQCKEYIDANTEDYRFILVRCQEVPEKRYSINRAPAYIKPFKLNY